jgi:hypothetical protein
MKDRREALKTVRVVQSAPAGWTDMGSISTRRCHRYFTEAQPSEAAMIPDLKMAAFGQGADAIKVIGFQKVNGLAADCWYVLEGSAEMYGKPSG